MIVLTFLAKATLFLALQDEKRHIKKKFSTINHNDRNNNIIGHFNTTVFKNLIHGKNHITFIKTVTKAFVHCKLISFISITKCKDMFDVVTSSILGVKSAQKKALILLFTISRELVRAKR